MHCYINCKSDYASQKGKERETVIIYGFPKDPTECHKWVSSLPNKVEKMTEHMEYVVDTGPLILLTFEEEDIS